jgi:hypothetical protein
MDKLKEDYNIDDPSVKVIVKEKWYMC